MNDRTTDRPDPALAASDGFHFELDGGHEALDFANTISRRADPADSTDRLTHYGRLVSWGVDAKLIAPKDAERLRAEAVSRPRAAVAALRRAVAVREAIFSVFVAIARGERAPAGALSELNAALPEAMAALRVAAEREAFAWRFTHEPSDLAPMLAPVVRAAADLLTSKDLTRVRECQSETCFWLFLDASKNGTRRWCDMKVCGNRAKARRHYRREKTAAKPRRTTGHRRLPHI
jgi:predicted RNA-binding Zn ribbon-like protein